MTGKVSSTRTGRNKVLNSPRTNAAIIAEPKLLTLTPGYRYATRSKAAASNSHRTTIFIWQEYLVNGAENSAHCLKVGASHGTIEAAEGGVASGAQPSRQPVNTAEGGNALGPGPQSDLPPRGRSSPARLFGTLVVRENAVVLCFAAISATPSAGSVPSTVQELS